MAVSQSVVNRKHFCVISFMNCTLKIIIGEKYFQNFEKLFVHLPFFDFDWFYLDLFRFFFLIIWVFDHRFQLWNYWQIPILFHRIIPTLSLFQEIWQLFIPFKRRYWFFATRRKCLSISGSLSLWFQIILAVRWGKTLR